MSVLPEAFFLPIGTEPGNQRFCHFYPAQVTFSRGMVLYIHPFAEEMNKARHMAALQTRELARTGYSVLQMDLLGCGDSSGDFGDATWQSWVEDVLQGYRWLRQRCTSLGLADEESPLWLWGLRAGGLLAVEAARQMDLACHFVFWQPPATGKLLLQQFLRLKVTSDLMGGQTKGLMQTLRQQLTDGLPIEVAGYTLSSGLTYGLEQATLAPPVCSDRARRVVWLELSTREGASLSPASHQLISDWQQAGFQLASHVVQGPAFWQTTELEDAPALILATTEALAGD